MKRSKIDFPVIGIRPCIDAREGRLGVRQSLEDQTMNMAYAVKELYEKSLKYSNGEPVKVIINKTTIGRVAESAECENYFQKEGVSITLSVTPCWCYGSETMDMCKDTIKAVWGFNGTERPGAVYLASVLASHAQKGLPAFGIYGKDVKDLNDNPLSPDIEEKLLRFARAAIAVKTMKGNSYLQIGSICMGIAGSIINPEFFEKYLGMRVESVDEVEVLRRIDNEIYDKEEYNKALEWTKKQCKIGFDKNLENIRKTDEQKEKDLEFVVKTAIIIKDLMSGNLKLKNNFHEESLGHNAIAAGFQGQRQWTDHYPNADFAESILNTSFDWLGAREPYILATENDTLNGVTMLMLKLLTGRAQIFADVRTCWNAASVERVTGYKLEGEALKANGIIHLINSGACCLDASGEAKDQDGNAIIKPFYEMTDNDIANCLKATTWCPADNGYFRGGGFSSRFETKAVMPITMARLNLVDGLGPVMQIAEGYTVKLPDEVSDALWKRTDYTWPCTWFAPIMNFKCGINSAYDVMNNWGANHGAISYGHVGADLITLCSMLRIPVCMHNVADEKIFRPSVWNCFGTDKEGADYRACKNFGPLYK